MTFFFSSQKIEELGGGISRRILAFDKPLMLVEMYFDQGAVGALHSHPHDQIAWVKEGCFEFELQIAGKTEKQLLNAGDSIFLAGKQSHGAVCVKTGLSGKGVLHDIFTPQRNDFLS